MGLLDGGQEQVLRAGCFLPAAFVRCLGADAECLDDSGYFQVARQPAHGDHCGDGCGRLASMVETLVGAVGADGILAAAQLLHDFNVEYDEPAPSPDELAVRLAELIDGGHVVVLLARAHESGEAVGVAVMRVQLSIFSSAQEAYLAELYVVPSRRGQGFGSELITEVVRVAREQGADYAFVVTSEEDRLARRLYEAAGFRRTEGEGGPLMLAYEREL